MEPTRAVISLSGGLDSAVLLTRMLREPNMEIYPITFEYASKHNRWEGKAVKEIMDHFHDKKQLHPVKFVRLDFFGQLFKSDLLVTGGPIPQGHYEAESMKQTVVPGRNTIFLAILMGYAESINGHMVAIGAHAGDHHIYPDCRPGFVHAMDCTMQEATEGKVHIYAPFLHIDKVNIVAIGNTIQTPFGITRTCYADQPTACGKCGSCQERLTAFHANGLVDPLVYESRAILPKEKR